MECGFLQAISHHKGDGEKFYLLFVSPFGDGTESYMKINNKVFLIEKYKRCQKIQKKDFRQIVMLAKDRDPYVRMDVASLLGKLQNNNSKKLLLILATDKNVWVRMEAYEQLAVFVFLDVEKFLRRAIMRDRNQLSCSYAIMAWVNVANELCDDNKKNLKFIAELKKIPKIYKSEYCLLECYYAMYLWGKKKVIMNILNFFSSKNYHVRYAALHILYEIVDEENQDLIIKKLEEALFIENTLGLRKDMYSFLKELILMKNV